MPLDFSAVCFISNLSDWRMSHTLRRFNSHVPGVTLSLPRQQPTRLEHVKVHNQSKPPLSVEIQRFHYRALVRTEMMQLCSGVRTSM